MTHAALGLDDHTPDLLNKLSRILGSNRHASTLKPTDRAVLECLLRLCNHSQEDWKEHFQMVGMVSACMARMCGLPDREVESLYFTAQLHDIGKLAVPEWILQKPSRLTALEHESMKRHTLLGFQMLNDPLLPQVVQEAASIALSHHERYDGSGYPHGLQGTNIPFTSRVVAIADVFEALISARPYKPAWQLSDALTWMKSQRGSHFDPELLDIFMDLCQS